MSKFRFYIADTFNGEVKGTNDEDVAKDIAKSEDAFVVDTERGVWLLADGDEVEVKETLHEVAEEEEDLDDEDDEGGVEDGTPI